MTAKPKTIIIADEEYAVIPLVEYDTLRAIEDAADSAALQRVFDEPDQEFVPGEVVDRLINGENRVRVWREYRGMGVGELADAAGVSAACLSDIENGKKPSRQALERIAELLRLNVDDLIG